MSKVLPNSAPIELRVAPRGAALAVAWAEGSSSLITSLVLRRACRCASCIAARTEGKPVVVAENVTVAEVHLIGDHAVNIGFSDGHARGIYPWPFLRELARPSAD